MEEEHVAVEARNGTNPSPPHLVENDGTTTSAELPEMGGGKLDYFSSLVDVLPKESREIVSEEELDKDPEYVALHEKLHSLVPRCGVTFSFQDVSFHTMVKSAEGDSKKKTMKRKDILVNVSGLVRPGEALAIMGASGSGKTVLLNALTGRIDSKNLSGKVLTNGSPPSADFKRISKFVAHTDDLLPMLTVRETMMYAAELQLPPSFTKAQKAKLVAYTIRDLGLDICADTYVGGGFMRGISGGQRRRLVLGIELLTQPCVLFLDTPTSGLDSTAATVVMERIFSLCKHHETSVISSIMAPSSHVFSRFDKVLLLWAGRSVFFGPPAKLEEFFAELNHPTPALINPSDHMMIVINTNFEDGSTEEEVSAMCDHFAQSSDAAKLQTELEELPQKFTAQDRSLPKGMGRYGNNIFVQFWLLFKRSMIMALRNPIAYWVRVGMYTVLSLMMGLLFRDIGFQESKVQDRVSLIFFTIAFFLFCSVAGMPPVIQERHIFVRERGNKTYQVSAYVMATFLASLPWVFLIGLFSSLVMYWLVQFHEGRFGFFLCFLFLGLLAAESLIVAVASIVPSFIVGLAAAAGGLGFFMLLAGFFISTPSIPEWWKWAYYLSFENYTFRGMLTSDLKGLVFNCDGSNTFPEFCPNGATTGTFTGEQVMTRYEMNSDTRGRDAGILIAIMVFFRVLTYLLLRFFQRGKMK